MGMDVFGKAPTHKLGEYFRSNVWYWHPLWRYCEELAPDIIPRENLGHLNDGWGLDARDALALACRLATELEFGRTAQYELDDRARRAAIPLDTCTICGGTGRRAEPPQIGPGHLHCNGCDGAGEVPNFAANYVFSTEVVGNFALFLQYSGGFEIL